MDKVIEAFGHAIGFENVSTDASNFETTTFPTNIKIAGTLYPRTREQVQACVAIANENHIRLYPISTGMNVGLGGKVPNTNNCMILNLSLMVKILDFNEDLAYITIEPGVTQLDIFEFLITKNSNLSLSITGSFPWSSIVGNAADRGDTSGPYFERNDYVCNLGIVLATGEFIRTGAGGYANSKIADVTKWGIGPDLTGLFIQSNLGIITELTLWLAPKAKAKEVIFFTLNNDKQIAEACNTLRDLKLQGLVEEANIRNIYKIAQNVTTYPWNQADTFETWLDAWRKRFMLGKWNGFITLSSQSKQINAARKKIIYRRLKNKVDWIISTSDVKCNILLIMKYLLLLLGKNVSLLIAMKASLKNSDKPNITSVKSLFWRKQFKANIMPNFAFPEKDKVGFIWCSVIIPAKGNEIVNAINIAENTILKYQYEPNLCALFHLGERAVLLPCVITYDRDIAGEDAKAMQCYNELLKNLLDAGYYPNRLGIQSMNALPKSDYDNELFIAKLKKLFDPNDIIAPGRYDYRHLWPAD